MRRFLFSLFRQPQSAVGTLLVLAFLILALAGSMFTPYSPTAQNNPPRLPPGGAHLLGTDYLGRDVFSRIIVGARSILFNAGMGTAIAVTLGALLGLFIGYRGGWVDEIFSRIVDAFLALPPLLIALVTLGIIRQIEVAPGTWQAALADQSVLLVISIVYVPLVTRLVRSVTLEIKTREFVQAAQTQGESDWSIIVREILPSVVPALVVEASLRFSYAIFLVASLGFLGVGVRPPTPDWGWMVNENRGGIYAITPWALQFPALAISLLVVGVNLMSDGIRRAVQKNR